MTACVVLVVLTFVSVMLYVVITQVVLPSRVAVMVGVVVWFATMSWPVTLLGLAAASLRRLALGIVAIVIGLAHTAALLALLFLIVADLSVSASVVSAKTVGLMTVAVGLATAGAVLSQFGPRRRWPVTAIIGIVVGTIGNVVSIIAEAVSGPLLPAAGGPGTVSPLAFLTPVAVVLIGLAVSWRSWPLAGAAGVALLVTMAVSAAGLVSQGALIVADEHGGWLVLQPVVATVRTLLASLATVMLTISLLRSPRHRP